MRPTSLSGHLHLTISMVRCGSKNGHQKDVLRKIGLHAHNVLTVLDSIINIIEGHLYDHLMRERIFTLSMNRKLMRAPNIMKKNGYEHDLELRIIVH